MHEPPHAEGQMLLIFKLSRITRKLLLSYFLQIITILSYRSDENYNPESFKFHLESACISLTLASTSSDTAPEDTPSPGQRG